MVEVCRGHYRDPQLAAADNFVVFIMWSKPASLCGYSYERWGRVGGDLWRVSEVFSGYQSSL